MSKARIVRPIHEDSYIYLGGDRPLQLPGYPWKMGQVVEVGPENNGRRKISYINEADHRIESSTWEDNLELLDKE